MMGRYYYKGLLCNITMLQDVFRVIGRWWLHARARMPKLTPHCDVMAQGYPDYDFIQPPSWNFVRNWLLCQVLFFLTTSFPAILNFFLNFPWNIFVVTFNAISWPRIELQYSKTRKRTKFHRNLELKSQPQTVNAAHYHQMCIDHSS